MTCRECRHFFTGKIAMPVLPAGETMETFRGLIVGAAEFGGTCTNPNGKCQNAGSRWHGEVLGPQGGCPAFEAVAQVA